MTSIVGFFGLNARGDTVALALASGGLLFAIAANLIRMHVLLRTLVFLVPPALGFLYVLAEAPSNLGGVVWLFMFAVGTAAWLVGCLLGIVLRRAASDS